MKKSVSKPNKKIEKSSDTKLSKTNENEVLTLVTLWEKAWEKKDIKTYLDFYSHRFRGNKMDYKLWKKHKSKIFRSQLKINIKITDIVFKKRMSGNITVNFVQHYITEKYSDVGIKTQRWLKEKGGWKIIRENWKPK